MEWYYIFLFGKKEVYKTEVNINPMAKITQLLYC